MTSFNHRIGPSQYYSNLSIFVSNSEPTFQSSNTPTCSSTIETRAPITFAHLAPQKESIPAGKMKRTVTPLGDTVYSLHNNSYVISPLPARQSTFKKLYRGVNLVTNKPVYALVGDLRPLEHEVNIIKSIPPSAYLLKFLDYATVNSKLCYIFVPLKNQGSLIEYRAKLQKRTPMTHLKVVRSILRGLCHLHQHGIVHLDIKPDNILVDVRKNRIGKLVTEIQITDFGTACWVEDTHRKVFALGTLDYLSPEQLHSINTAVSQPNTPEIDGEVPQECLDAAAKITTASDIYSLSITIMKTFTSINPKKETAPYWNEEWGTSSPLRNDLPQDRPTVEECLEGIDYDIRNLRKERNKLEKE